MGVINPENTLGFRSSSELFNRVRDKLKSFDSQNMIDEGTFYDHVAYVLGQLGAGVYQECEAMVPVADGKAPLPCNFKLWYAAYVCQPEFGGAPDINPQNTFGQPYIYYQTSEITQQCGTAVGCGISCEATPEKTRVVVRTYVNGDNFNTFYYQNPVALYLSPNVKDKCAPWCMKVNANGANEVTIADRQMRVRFNGGCIYMQYYGIAMDEKFLPMIPDEESIEKAIEYYIYKMLYEEWYLNNSVPNIIQQLQYVSQQYDQYFAQARYWVRLPSFQKMIQHTRVLRSVNKFYSFASDKTRVGADYLGYGGRGGGQPLGGIGSWGYGYGYGQAF